MKTIELGDMQIIGEPSPKLMKALAVIASELHPTFFAQPQLKPGISRKSCVLCSLTVRDFLQCLGFHAKVRPVSTVMYATEKGKQLHSLGIGSPEDHVPVEDHWIGHMVVQCQGFIIDTTLYQAHRKQWPSLPGMMTLPLLPPDKRKDDYRGLPIISVASMRDEERDYGFQIAWFDWPSNRSWNEGPDVERSRRNPVIRHMLKTFGVWEGHNYATGEAA